MTIKTLLLLLATALALNALAQDAREVYRRGAGDFMLIHNGQMEPKVYGFDNLPYWPEGGAQGCVEYDGVEYRDVTLLFDAYRRQLMVQADYSKRHTELVRERVGHLVIGDEEYRWFDKESGAKISGYYMVRWRGEEMLCAVHFIPHITQHFEDRKIVRHYDWRHRYYLVKNGKWKRLRKKSYQRMIEQTTKL